MLAAAAISGAAGATVEGMGQVARTFIGVPHRLEVVSDAGGVTWINDSIATSPERTVAALRSFTPGGRRLVLLVGGKDKNLPWETFADEALQRVNFLIGFGNAGSMVINLVQERARYNKQPAPIAPSCSGSMRQWNWLPALRILAWRWQVAIIRFPMQIIRCHRLSCSYHRVARAMTLTAILKNVANIFGSWWPVGFRRWLYHDNKQHDADQ